jgi:hypothetical protein
MNRVTSEQPRFAPMTDDEIIAHYRAGTLIRELHRPADTTVQEELHARLAALHNSQSIDLLALSATPEFQGLDRRYFFTIQQVYRNAIPDMKATPSDMLELIRRIEKQIGGFAALPRGTLRIWIGQVPERAKEVVEMARSDAAFDRDILVDALVAFGDETAATSFIAAADARRQPAIAALGAIKPRSMKAADATLGRLIAIVDGDPDEDVRFTAVSAAFDLLARRKTRAPKWVSALIDAVTAKPSDTTRTALLNGLWRHAELFRTAHVKAMLELACDGDLTAGRIVEMLSSTLYQLIGGPHHDPAIDCLTTLLASSGKAMPFEKLQLLEHRLTALERPMLFAIAVRWFATGDHALCQTMSKLIGVVHDQQPFDASLEGRGLTGNQVIVLCHKAVGYMPLAPIVAASFVIAALRAGDKDAEPGLVQLLFHALLINFRETVADYLKKIGKADVAYGPVRAALKLFRRYEKDSDIEVPIKELQPSAYQRAVVRQNHYISNREIRKQAERQSAFFGTVHKSTLLYGRKAITYARGADEAPTSMELREMSSYIEMPRLQTVDPVGQAWLYQIYRSSRPK